MGSGEIGKWAWYIALVVAVVGGLLSSFDVDFLSGGTIGTVVGLLALVGGYMHLADGDRTAFYIAAAALTWFAAGDVFGLGQYVNAILGGAAAAAGAGAAGVLFKTVQEWVTDI